MSIQSQPSMVNSNIPFNLEPNSSTVPSSISAALNQSQSDHKIIQGFDISEIAALDLRGYRNSNLSGASYLLILIPVIGWIALVCLKYHSVVKHRSAEKIMESRQFASKTSIEEKINVIVEAINVSGPHAWQYRLELARLHLLQGNFNAVANDLIAVRSQRGTPHQTGWYNVRNLGLVSFQLDNSSRWEDPKFVIKIHYNDGEEALLHAALFAANNRYVEAYDAYNEVIYYDRLLANSRKHQSVLVDQMIKNPHLLDLRGRDILSAERPSK